MHGLGTNRKTIQVHQCTASQGGAASCSCSIAHVHRYEEMRKAHNSDVCSLEWDDTCCVTYMDEILGHNTEIKHSKMLKLMRNLQCRSNFTKISLLDSSHQNSPRRPCFTKCYQQISQNSVALPCLLWKR